MKRNFRIAALFFAVLVLSSCQKEEIAPQNAEIIHQVIGEKPRPAEARVHHTESLATGKGF